MDFSIEKEKLMKGKNLNRVELLPQLTNIEMLMTRTCEYFFKGNITIKNFPFKGFILEGPPGTGKTEIVKQVARKLDSRLQNVYYYFVDGASIAAPKWGEAEQKLRKVFLKRNEIDYFDSKLIILFDDIESLMIRRGVELAKEWHYSINSILFHEIDNLNPSKVLVCATTNKPDLVDDAIRTRLYQVKIPYLLLDQLMIIVKEILESSDVNEKNKKYIIEVIRNRLNELDNPTIRDAQQITVIECIEKGVWLV